jgi:uncharacterized protein (TIGR02284 family)
MLRDDKQTALNDVIYAVKDSAHHYREAADIVSDVGLADLFRTIARQRETLVTELEVHIRRLHDLPREPDPDREIVDAVITRLKAALTGDERLSVLDEREQAEDELRACIEVALAQALPEATQAVLTRLLNEAIATQERLFTARQKT